MKTVWKFPLVEKIEMPMRAEILSISTQGGEPMIWALVNPEAKKEVREFMVFGTGHNVPSGLIYRGTFLQAADALVWHVFENPGLRQLAAMI